MSADDRAEERLKSAVPANAADIHRNISSKIAGSVELKSDLINGAHTGRSNDPVSAGKADYSVENITISSNQ